MEGEKENCMLANTKELAAALNVHALTVRRMVADGRIPAKYYMRIGRNYRFNKQAILEHLLKK